MAPAPPNPPPWTNPKDVVPCYTQPLVLLYLHRTLNHAIETHAEGVPVSLNPFFAV